MTVGTLGADVRSAIEEFNRGDLDAFLAHLGRAYYAHVPGADEPAANEVIGALLRDLRDGFADLRIELDELADDPDPGDGSVHGRATLAGTYTGRLWGVPATGRRVSWPVEFRVRAVDGSLALNLEGLNTPAIIGLLREIEQINPPDQMHLPPIHAASAPPEFLMRLAFNGQVADKPCTHLDQVRVTGLPEAPPAASPCAECPPDGVWPTVRMCLTCGHLGCCDTSLLKHARAHFESTGHPIMRSIRNGEAWMWCYVDGVLLGRRTLERLAMELDA